MGDVDPYGATQNSPGDSDESSADAARASQDVESSDHPERIGRYRIEKVLGKGGFGLVYLAHDEQLDRRVAVKVPHAKLVSQPKHAEDYLTEARTVANLDHPHIVPVHDVGSTDEFPCYIVSKYVEGIDLAIRLKQSPLKRSDAAELVATVAEALHCAHKQGLVHRDVKPGNILIGNDGKPYVVDFGLALREENIGKGPQYAGTPAYMSPEQARGEGHRVDGRSDIYSRGAVLYELLVGRRTFTADTQAELLEQITSQEVKPPRQINDAVSKELERICLKALSKRASERYTTALDMAEDLRHFLAELPAVTETTTTSAAETHPVSDSTQVPADSAKAASDSQPIRIVPKGLRSFDEHDADFFLELLPGPRDRVGLPDSIRFWKTRIEETDTDKTISVGLIYGPSGCGKSSLVKAGLLPRLADHVTAIYVEATADDTEARLLGGLRKHCTDLPEGLSLRQSLAALRRGEGLTVGHKVVIVLDQFEQWLHGNRDKEDTELVQALRQCDGGNVQCVVMVRDDFWMAVTRFLAQVEVELVQGHNFAPVDLFDVRHARRVLSAYGRAYGVLPDSPEKATTQQRQFVERAAAGLGEDNKVICVRLALFAEMMKSRAWSLASLREVGGTSGVGVTFLEETFSTHTNPKHRLHQKAARAVLKSLLPESGTDIKGQMRSVEELREASGYADRQRDFDELMHILDSELRLITPTDPAGIELEEDLADAVAPGQRFYQLTHDYLVHSLRDWLTRKQNETRKGRAELRLAERSALWNAKRENRHLPAWWEYGNIRLLTSRQNWTEPERAMMAKARWVHGVRWGSTLLVALVIGITIQQIVHSSRQRTLRGRTETAVTAMSTARGNLVPHVIKSLQDFPREMVLAELREQFAVADETKKLALAYALAHYGDLRVEFLLSQVEDASPDEVDNFVVALDRSSTEAVTALEAAAHTAESEQNWRYKTRLAILLLHLKTWTLSPDMCRLRPDPIQRTVFIEECSSWHGDLSKLARLVADTDDGPLRSAIILAVGSVPVVEVLPPEKQAWEPVLLGLYEDEPDTLTHSAAGWVLRRWKLFLPEIAASKQPVENYNWHVNDVGMTMLKIPAGSFLRKGLRKDSTAGYVAFVQTVTLTRSFLLADREVTREQFQQFIDDPAAEKPTDWKERRTEYSSMEQHPVGYVSWYDAVLFSNWLSRKEGLAVCYERTGKKEDVGRREYDAWRLIREATGYRLPTEAEWEYACRAGTVTTFSHGDEESLLDRYAVYKAGRMELCGRKLPNGWGLFDVHGNVAEWCHDWKAPFGSETALSDPLGPVERSRIVNSRVLRGGRFRVSAEGVRSTHRSFGSPFLRPDSYGFRLARTYP
jgi:serine/threonine protein kinase/formylglycine-generating enzyme required for sulfatase activity